MYHCRCQGYLVNCMNCSGENLSSISFILLKQNLIQKFLNQTLIQEHKKTSAGCLSHVSMHSSHMFCYCFSKPKLHETKLVCLVTVFFFQKTIHCCIETSLFSPFVSLLSAISGEVLYLSLLLSITVYFLSSSMCFLHLNISSTQTQTAKERGSKDGNEIALFVEVRSQPTHVVLRTVASQLSSDYVHRLLYGTALASNSSVDEVDIRAGSICFQYARISYY